MNFLSNSSLMINILIDEACVESKVLRVDKVMFKRRW